MKVAIGIILVIIGFWFIAVTIRACPPGTNRRLFARPSTWFDIANGIILVFLFCGVGIALVLGASWWSLLIGAVIGFLLIAIFNAFVAKRYFGLPSDE